MRASRKVTIPAMALALALAGCSGPGQSQSAPSATSSVAGSAQSADQLAAWGYAGLDSRQIIEKMDQSPAKRPTAVKASVRPDSLVMTDGSAQVTLPAPDDFYLSIAPYVSKTHDCFFHNLGTCQGEQASQPVHVTITDQAGKALVDEDTSTYSNGFVGFWLPRDISGTVTVKLADGKTGSVPFATGPKDASCLTTLQVA